MSRPPLEINHRFRIGQTIAQALIALKAYGLGVAGWAFGCAVYLVVTLVLNVHVTLEGTAI